MIRSFHFLFTAALLSLVVPAAQSQGMPDPAAVAEQQAAMAKLAMLHGEWRGPASINSREGKTELVQTERVGPMLGGLALVIEGRGYAADGSTAFNALAVISYDSVADQYWMQSWAGDKAGKMPLMLTGDGFSWKIEIPGGATIDYVATVKDGRWRETGSYAMPGRAPIPFVTLDLQKIGDTSWPGAGSVTAKAE